MHGTTMRSVLIVAALATSTATPGCATFGKHLVLTNHVNELAVRARPRRTETRRACAWSILPILFGLTTSAADSPFTFGDATTKSVMKQLVDHWPSQSGPEAGGNGKLWKLAYLTVEQRIENYLVVARICTIGTAMYVLVDAPRVATSSKPATDSDLACPSNTRKRSEQHPTFGLRSWCERQSDRGLWVKHGPLLEFHKNGRPFRRYHYQDDQRHGRFVFWGSGGDKFLEGEYQQGRKHGRWIWWRKDGTKQRECLYDLDRVVRCDPAQAP